MKKEYHVVLKNSSNLFIYADSFIIYNFTVANVNHSRIRFLDSKNNIIMNISENAVDEIFHYKNIFADERIYDYKALPFPDPDLYVDLS